MKSEVAARIQSKTPCKKASFRDEIAAEFFITKINSRVTKIRARMPQRSYLCPLCGFWHITSKKDKLKERIDELEAELKEVKAKLLLLSQATDKEDRVAIKRDTMVMDLKHQLKKRNEEVSRLHKDISTLVSKLSTQSKNE